MDRDEPARYLDQLLETARFRDYCPNGLQVEGCSRVERLVTGVTASLALLERAAAAGADAIFVHHGWFWRGGDGRIVALAGLASRSRCATRSTSSPIAAGHHASERCGVQAVGEHLAVRFGIEHQFIDIANPV